MNSLQRLLDIMAKLRSPEGCPWDLEQTHASLKRYLIEECYELVDAIEQNDPDAIVEELGDVLLQVVFHAQIAQEGGAFGMDDVINGIANKLVRRHPHVFADTKVDSVSDVLTNWEAIKKGEKANAQRKSILDGIPPALPSLMWAEKVQKKAAKVGFQWDDIEGAMNKFDEEYGELKSAIQSQSPAEIEGELGDVLFCLVNISRYLKTDPEFALRGTTAKFVRRFHYIEEKALQENKKLDEMTLDEMDSLWDEAKDYFRRNPQE